MSEGQITCAGFLFLNDQYPIDPYDYFDFKQMTWTLEQLEADLKLNNLPHGTIVKFPTKRLQVVTKVYPGRGTVSILTDIGKALTTNKDKKG